VVEVVVALEDMGLEEALEHLVKDLMVEAECFQVTEHQVVVAVLVKMESMVTVLAMLAEEEVMEEQFLLLAHR
jgi:hypothetical protein